MSTRFKQFLILATSLCLSWGLLARLEAADHYTLLGRSSPAHMDVKLTANNGSGSAANAS